MATKPASVTIRVYNVGFGDCILLSWHYPSSDRHVLIDFGSSAHPEGSPANLMVKIANDIKAVTNNDGLEAVVVTHRHLDHINGFDPDPGGKGPGAIIAGLNPKLIVQPWTEHPKTTATSKSAPSVFAIAGPTRGLRGPHAAVDGLSAGIAAELAQRVRTWRGAPAPLLAEASHEITHAIANQDAVNNLRKMAVNAGKKGGAYVNAGQNSGLGKLLPGVTVSVLGPPSLKQVDESDLRYATNSPEYWMHLSAAQRMVVGRIPARSRAASVRGGRAPAYARWLVEKLRLQRATDLRDIVTALDNYLNNTSVILLFTIGTKALLFPGDAQLENWQYALKKYAAKLPGVSLYKVGHHGSRNATPKSLWNQFTHTGDSSKPGRLITVLSTKRGKFDDTNEVPREALVKELKKNSTLNSTLDAPADVRPITFDVTF